MRAAVLALAFAVLSAACGRGEPGALRVGIEAKYPPFESWNAEGRLEGFDVDLVEALGRRTGRRVEFKDMAWDALIPEVQSGRIDLICSGMSRNDERAKVVDFSRPYAQAPMGVLLGGERAAGVRGLADLDRPDVQVAVQRGTTGEAKARAAFPKAAFLVFGTEADAAREVASGRVHAFVYDFVSVEKFHRQYPDATRILDADLGVEEYCMVAAKGSPLLAEVDAFLAEATRPGGEVDRLMAKWLPSPERFRAAPR